MADFPLLVQKVVSSLPSVLTPHTLYLVRVGTGFDLYMTDSTGRIAHKLNIGLQIERGQNLFIRKTATPHYLTSSGTLANADAYNLVSDFIAVEEGLYMYQTWTNHLHNTSHKDQWHAYFFYDENKNIVGSRQTRMATVSTIPSQQYYRWDISVPNNVAFIRIGSRHLQNGQAMFERVKVFGDFIPAPEDT